ncbi:ABC transporter ATP-binding protein [Kineococcus esterisolvens]|uniref:ABC transporter ATP-binding protein n=1 Tax=unclassified Kineococcus TaxID=2621656 RepID=UPI003D7D1C42
MSGHKLSTTITRLPLMSVQSQSRVTGLHPSMPSSPERYFPDGRVHRRWITSGQTAGMAALQVEGISFRYTGANALSEVTFTVGPGVTALLGVNGAGKSTLMSICAGLLTPKTGAVHIASHALYSRTHRRAALAAVSLMPQATSFPANLTARDVVTYLGWLRGLPRSAASARAEECLVAVGLHEVADRKCGTFSGGMTRRLALAQALVSQPEVILLDEPSTGLDPQQRRGMVELIRALPATVLLSSHVVEDVEDLAAHVIVLDGGRVVFDGTTAALTEGIEVTGRRSAVEAGFLRAIAAESTHPDGAPGTPGARERGAR